MSSSSSSPPNKKTNKVKITPSSSNKKIKSEFDQPHDHFLNSRNGWIAVWLFRVVQAVFLVKGADVPDEWWQSTEVAEYVVFGKGELTWEWSESEALRSFVYPLPFIVVFYFLKITSLESFPFLVWLLPRIMAATTCFGIDYMIGQVAKKRLFPHERAFTLSLVLSLSSWFLGFVGVRTQSNVAEALAFMIALNSKSFIGFLFCCGLGCAFRVTFAIPAIVLFYHQLQDRCFSTRAWNEIQEEKKKKSDDQDDDEDVESNNNNNKDVFGNKSDEDSDDSSSSSLFERLDMICCPPRRAPLSSSSLSLSLLQHFGVSVLIVLLTVLGISLIDSVFYGRFTCSPLNFLIFNVVSGLSKLFGTHPIHWYFTSALPVMFLALTPLAMAGHKAILAAAPPIAYANRPGCGVECAKSKNFVIRLVEIVSFSTLVMSLLGHKEMRFLYFTVPCMILIASASWSIDPWLWKKRRLISTATVVINIGVFLFFGLLWQRGPISTASFLRSSSNGGCEPSYTVHALTHCFSMPGESFFHGCAKEFIHNSCPVVQLKNLPLDDWRVQEREILSEHGMNSRFSVVLPTANDMFLESPLVFVEYLYEGKEPESKLFKKRVDAIPRSLNNNEDEFSMTTYKNAKRRQFPARFILYDCHEEILSEFLKRNGYEKIKTFFHTWIPLEDYHGKNMLVYEKKM